MPKHSQAITAWIREDRARITEREKELREMIEYYSAQSQTVNDKDQAYAPVCIFMVARAKKDLATLAEARKRLDGLSQKYHELAHAEGSAETQFSQGELLLFRSMGEP